MALFVALDLETTGVNPREDFIIEYALIKFDADTFREVEVLSGFVNPGVPIPLFIKELTAISDEDVLGAPSIQEVIQDVSDFLSGLPIVGHNVNFDISFLEAAGVKLDKNPLIDTFSLANFTCYNSTSLNLSSLCEDVSIVLEGAHRASNDTRATIQLFSKLIEKIQKQVIKSPEIYQYIYSRSESIGDQILYRQYFKHLLKECEDFGEVSELKNIHKKRLKSRAEPLRSTSTSSSVSHISSYDSLQKFSDITPRESQKAMCDIIDKLYQSSGKIAIEAPTGTGKTFGYLIPSILHAKRSGEQICIATSTKLLQDQICEADISHIQNNLTQDFTFTKIMGRANYVSLYAYYEYIGLNKKFSSEQVSFLLKIYEWSLETEFGELRELNFYAEEHSFLYHVNSEGNIDGYTYDDVGEFYLKAKNRINTSDIIITNTHVLLQDLFTDNSVLGDIDSFIIDEAHCLEDVVTSSQLETFTELKLRQVFSVIERKLQFYNCDCDIDDFISKIEFLVSEIFHYCGQILHSKTYYNALYKKYRFTGKDFESGVWISKNILQISELFREIIESLSLEGHHKYFYKDIYTLESIKSFLTHYFHQSDFEKYIYFGEILQNGDIMISSTILDTGNFLKDEVWDKKQRVILVSATLLHPHVLDYSNTLLGISGFQKHILPSTFDYSRQAQIYIPTNLVDTKNLDNDTLSFLTSFFTKVKGKTLMLCTSYNSIKNIYLSLHSKLSSQDIQLLAQGFAGGKNKHLKSFMKYPERSILIGTDAFWQGVDIPGDNLTYLIIHKLPFTAPSDPIFLGRSTLFRNSFSQYAVPKTCIKLGQGLGRLIRSEDDTGMIFLLDNRVITQKWGKVFLDIFPENIPVVKSTYETLLEFLD